MSERRYDEDEVAAIFAQAARPPDAGPARPSPASGMTLAELQEIGREVGLSPDDVARAAAALDRIPQTTTRRLAGLPIGVGRTVELGRRLSDAEWERLVVDLRATFQAEGRLGGQGALRQWSNGNLHALLEPTESGHHRVRLQTLKGSARDLMASSAALLGTAGGLLILDGVSGAELMPAIGLVTALGLGMFGAAALRLPAWLKLRRAQFDAVIARLLASLGPQPQPPPALASDAEGTGGDAAPTRRH